MEGVNKAYEVLFVAEREIFEEFKKELQCTKCLEKNESHFSGRSGKSESLKAVTRARLACNKCKAQFVLHGVLKDCGIEKAVEAASRLDSLKSAVKMEMDKVALTQDQDPVDSAGSNKRAREPETPVKPAQKLLATPNRSAFGGIGEAPEEVPSDPSALLALVLRLQDDMSVLKSKMRVVADENTALKLRLGEYEKQEEGMSRDKPSEAMAGPKPTSPNAKAPDAKAPDAKATETTKGTYAAAANTPKKPTPTGKALRDLKARIAPRPRQEYVKRNLRWAPKAGEPVKESIASVWMLLRAAKVAWKIREISFIGKSVLELYIRAEEVDAVVETLTKFVGSKVPLVWISTEHLQEFGHYKVDKETLATKVEARLTVLCARNPYKGMQECILSDVKDAGKKAAIIEKAARLRESWAIQRGMGAEDNAQ